MNEETTKEMQVKERRLQWFREAKFGMFIHWGVYSQLAGEWKGELITRIGEQIMRFCSIPIAEYEEVAKSFNPTKFNAEEWVLLAKSAGMKYIIITAKHHDGFAMYDSKCSTYDIVDVTPFGRDPMKELAEACRKHDIKLCFYYSQYQDWHHPHGAVKPPQWDGMPEEQKDFEIYLREKAIPQVTELLTQYGPIGIIWYDTPGGISKEHAQELVDLVHTLQPDCLVSPRVGHDLGDYQGFGDNMVPSRSNLYAWETCATMNETWGFRKNAHDWKSTETLVRLLVSIVSKGGNYLLNIGPTGEGVVPQPSVDGLHEIGEWMKVNSEAIYGSTGCLVPYELNWGAMTAKPGRLYFHLFDWPQGSFTFYGLKNKVKKICLLADPDKKPLEFKQSYDAAVDLHTLEIQLPAEAPDKYVSVLVLEIDEEVEIDTSLKQQPEGDIILDGFLAEVHRAEENSLIQISGSGIVENWFNTGDWLSWEFKVMNPGSFDIDMTTVTENEAGGSSERRWEGGHEFVVSASGAEYRFKVEDHERTFPRDNYRYQIVHTNCGRVTFDKPGIYKVELKPVTVQAEKELGPKLKSLDLKKV